MTPLVDTGVFTISIDLELGWGMIDTPMTCTDLVNITAEREVVERLLALFASHEVKATWAIVGHLLLDHVAGKGSTDLKPPQPGEYVVPNDLFDQVGESCRDLWCARDVIKEIRRATPEQELASHSFSHVRYDEGCTRRKVIEADVAQLVRIHNENQVPFKSFVFPYNCAGYRYLLAMAGVQAYRGMTPRWYHGITTPCIRRLANLVTVIAGFRPKTVMPSRDDTGMINIPDSMLWYSTHGIRRFIPDRRQVCMAKAALDQAALERSVFHLWFHPSNFVHDMARQLARLEEVLAYARSLESAGRISILTMNQLTETLHDGS